MTGPRGYFGVAVWKPKTTDNVGTLWRTANILGASFIAVIAGRYQKQASDTMATHRHIPLYHFETFADFKTHQPSGCRIIAVELCDGACNLVDYAHPEQAVYLLGPEDGSLSPDILAECHSRLVIPGSHCYNLAVAGSIVMYDRVAKAGNRRLAA